MICSRPRASHFREPIPAYFRCNAIDEAIHRRLSRLLRLKIGELIKNDVGETNFR